MRNFFLPIAIATISLNASSSNSQRIDHVCLDVPQGGVRFLTNDGGILDKLARLEPGKDRYVLRNEPTMETICRNGYGKDPYLLHYVMVQKSIDEEMNKYFMIALSFALRLKKNIALDSLENPNICVTDYGVLGFDPSNGAARDERSANPITWSVLNKMCEILTNGKEKNVFDPKIMAALYQVSKKLTLEKCQEKEEEQRLQVRYEINLGNASGGNTKIRVEMGDTIEDIKRKLANLVLNVDRFPIGNQFALTPVAQIIKDYRRMRLNYNVYFLKEDPKRRKLSALFTTAAAYFRYQETRMLENPNVLVLEDSYFEGHAGDELDKNSIVRFEDLLMVFNWIIAENERTYKGNVSASSNSSASAAKVVSAANPLFDRIKTDSERFNALLKIANSNWISGEEKDAITREAESILKSKIMDENAAIIIRQETETQKAIGPKEGLAINSFWKGILEFSLANGLRQTWKNFFWISPEAEQSIFMNKISTDEHFLKAVLIENKMPLFRYTTPNRQRYNVTSLTLIEGLLFVFDEYRLEILSISPDAQEIYDGILRNISKSAASLSEVSVKTENEYEMIVVLNSAKKAYEARAKKLVDYYDKYYVVHAAKANVTPLTKERVVQILDENGLSGFFEQS
ncbi:MAG: hypothetical protein HEEMFOPI_01072 [Holosporales bacterium]